MTKEDVLKFNLDNMHRMYYGCTDNPVTIQEKLRWLNIYDIPWSDKYDKPLKSVCADKLLVKEYAKEKLGKEIGVPTLKIYNTFDEIDFAELPEKFVLKTNHNYGGNFICKDKSKLNISVIKPMFEKWLSSDFVFGCGFESHYHWIDRKIFAEQFLEDTQKVSLIDYKFHCFNGEPKLLQIISDRTTNAFHCNYYDMDGIKLDLPRIDIKTNDILDSMPKNFELMKEYARKLSEPFKFVRVDFYEVNNEVYLGELTFTPGACCFKFKRDEDDVKIGNLLKL